MKARHITWSHFSDASLSYQYKNIVQYFISDILHFKNSFIVWKNGENSANK